MILGASKLGWPQLFLVRLTLYHDTEHFKKHFRAELNHYNITVKKDSSSPTRDIMIVYSCRYNDPKHTTANRTRDKLRGGTGNLHSSATTCDKRAPSRLHPASSDETPAYSEAMHRAIITIRCAASKRSYESLRDPLYLREVHLLRPGTLLPAPQTGQRDLVRLHEGFKAHATNYFVVRACYSLPLMLSLMLDQKHNRDIHGVADGWGAPIHVSELGLVLVWEQDGVVYRVLLEMIR